MFILLGLAAALLVLMWFSLRRRRRLAAGRPVRGVFSDWITARRARRRAR